MHRDRADAIAEAIAHPDTEARAALHARREQEARSLAERRRVAVLVLVGFTIGALAAWATGERFTRGGLLGAIAAGALGWLWIALVDRRRRGA
ncbi:hypothetical protein GCM10028862_03040 [Luteimonas pelagia]